MKKDDGPQGTCYINIFNGVFKKDLGTMKAAMDPYVKLFIGGKMIK